MNRTEVLPGELAWTVGDAHPHPRLPGPLAHRVGSDEERADAALSPSHSPPVHWGLIAPIAGMSAMKSYSASGGAAMTASPDAVNAEMSICRSFHSGG